MYINKQIIDPYTYTYLPTQQIVIVEYPLNYMTSANSHSTTPQFLIFHGLITLCRRNSAQSRDVCSSQANLAERLKMIFRGCKSSDRY